ncbi:aminoacyltransferase [Streptococcus catagoni]|uniref:aminoacyltransferase n=1 Tax=Streptococcus catagoni TaxID=2654874 RepID=UPI0014075348|nr:aminoacyltransferase [Streptococcus catagoni]
MYTYKVGISPDEHDAFLLANEKCNLLQSSKWGSVKEEWDHELIGFYQDQDQELVATASILIKKLPLGFTMLYIPRGPIVDFSNYELLDFVISSLKKYGKTKHALFIKCDPTLFIKQYQLDSPDDNEEDELTLSVINFLCKRGLEWSGRTKDLSLTIQPRLQANLYANQFDLQSLPKKTKQAIRTAQNKGIDILVGGEELLADFADLMKKTEERKSIYLRGKDYYQKLMQTYPDNSYITMAKLDLKKRKEELTEQLTKALKIKSNFTEKSKETKIKENQNTISRIEKELDFLEQKLGLGHEIVPLAATLTVIFGQTSENLYAGMDEDYRHYQSAILTWYQTAKEAFSRGCHWQNMGGVENQLDGGLFHFKSKYNPTIEEFAGEFNIPVSPLFKPAMLAYNLRKQIRSKH